MAMLNPADLIKDHKGVLVPLLGAVIVIFGISAFLGSGGDYLGESQNVGEDIAEIGSDRNTYTDPPEMQLREGVDYSATIDTNYGEIEIDLFENVAPETVSNFVFLSEEGFYDNLVFHRVVSGFVIQGGDPNGDGTGGPGYTFDDEINPDSIGLDRVLVKDATFLSSLYSTYNAATIGYSPSSLQEHADDTLSNFYDDVIGYTYDYALESVAFEPGVIAMANSGPNTNGSQFFITVSNSDTSSLNGRHTVFGTVVSGMAVVDEIAEVRVDQSSKPISDVRINTVTIHEN